MAKNQSQNWLEWARELQAISQIGMHYSQNHYQTERFQRVGEIAAEMISHYMNLEYTEVMEIFNKQVGYATPKIDVRSAVFRDGKLLLVREIKDNGWTMPGGWVDVGDTPSNAAERETIEESGFVVKAERVIGVYDANRKQPYDLFHAFKIIFLCKIIDGSPKPSDETSEVAFFGHDEIPRNLSKYRTTPKYIEDAFLFLDNPNRPAFFD